MGSVSLDRLLSSLLPATTLERNNLLLQYNATIALVQKKQAEADSFEEHAKQSSSQILGSTTPALPWSTLFMEQCYTESLWILLESFSRTQRALRFWTLSSPDLIASTLRGDPTDFDALHTLRTKLLEAYANGIEHHFKHDKIKLQFRYWDRDMSFRGPGTVDGNIGEEPGARNGARDEFTPIGPFTTWLVEVSAKHNPGLDLSGVQEA